MPHNNEKQEFKLKTEQVAPENKTIPNILSTSRIARNITTENINKFNEINQKLI